MTDAPLKPLLIEREDDPLAETPADVAAGARTLTCRWPRRA